MADGVNYCCTEDAEDEYGEYPKEEVSKPVCLFCWFFCWCGALWWDDWWL